MKLSLGILTLWVVLAVGQSTECTAAMVATDDCAAVIDTTACVNEMGFRGAGTLTCIGGKDDADRKRKVCKCCACVGPSMCNWAKTQKMC